jgi:hypothetical protein
MTGWKQWLVVGAFVAAVALTGVFALRAVHHAAHVRPRVDESIRPWMSVPYIAHSYHVPPHVLFEAIGLPTRPDKRPIRAIAREQKRPVTELISQLTEAIDRARPPNPLPSASPAASQRRSSP